VFHISFVCYMLIYSSRPESFGIKFFVVVVVDLSSCGIIYLWLKAKEVWTSTLILYVFACWKLIYFGIMYFSCLAFQWKYSLISLWSHVCYFSGS